MRFRQAGGLALTVLALQATAAQAAPVETIVQDDALMLHAPEDEVRRAMVRARTLGIDRVRLTAGWSVIAPNPDSTEIPGDFQPTDPADYPAGSWEHLDRAVRLAHETGLAPMIDIAFWAPRWATKAGPGVNDRLAEEIDAAQYAEFATAVARRYSGSWVPPRAEQSAAPANKPPDRTFLDELFGTPPPEDPPPAPPGTEPAALPAVDTFTIWNEPNHPGFLRPQWVKTEAGWVPRSADIYRDMVRAAYPAIKSAAPGAKVLIGGTASMGSSTPGVSGVPPLRFLRALACVDDELQPVSGGTCAGYERLPGDGWAHHPYSLRTLPNVDTRDKDKLPVAATARLAATLRTLVAQGRVDPAVADLYMTEYGYETNRPDPNAPFSLDDQARLLAWAEFIATSEPSVRSWPQFQLYDRPDQSPRPGMREFGDWHSGLYFNDGSPKPAAAVYATPVHAECSGGQALVWGRLRGDRGATAVALETKRPGGDWQVLATTVASGGEAVRRRVKHVPGARYRLRWDSGRTSAESAPATRDCRSAKQRARIARAKRRARVARAKRRARVARLKRRSQAARATTRSAQRRS